MEKKQRDMITMKVQEGAKGKERDKIAKEGNNSTHALDLLLEKAGNLARVAKMMQMDTKNHEIARDKVGQYNSIRESPVRIPNVDTFVSR